MYWLNMQKFLSFLNKNNFGLNISRIYNNYIKF